MPVPEQPAGPPGAEQPAGPPGAKWGCCGSGGVPPELEVAIFKRLWIWLGSLSGFILVLGGLVWALSVSELKEYAKNVSENKAHEEWRRLQTEIAEGMRNVREDLNLTIKTAYAAVGDSRQRVGESDEISTRAKKLAQQIENELVTTNSLIKATGDVFCSKIENRK